MGDRPLPHALRAAHLALRRGLRVVLRTGADGVLMQALTEVSQGPLRRRPLFAYVVASPQMTLGGFGSAFWSLVIGTGVTLLEQQEWRAVRASA